MVLFVNEIVTLRERIQESSCEFLGERLWEGNSIRPSGDNPSRITLFYLICPRDPGFTGDAGLAETASIAFKTVIGGHVLVCPGDVLQAFELVMPFFGHGVYRAALDTLSADPLREEKAVFLVMTIGPRSRGYRDPGHHGAAAHGLADRGDQSVAKAECSQPRGMGRVPLRPV